MSSVPEGDDERYRLRLEPVQETLVIPLYGRAIEAAKPDGILRDEAAVRMVARIDYDFARLGRGPSLFGTVLRTCILDVWTRRFLTGWVLLGAPAR
jgi:O-methyltransferase involved in polyketide biosynthesis